MPTPADQPVTVVIPAWRNWATIDAVLRGLEPQLAPTDEVVIVESSADGQAAELQRRWPRARVLAQEAQTPTCPARNLGARTTETPLLAFLDADAVPDTGWLTGLRGALASRDAVGGSIRNGTPDSIVGTAGFLGEFMRWLPDAPTPDSLIGCNLLIRRSTYDAMGGFPEDIWPGEDTVLTYGLMQTGRAGFCPAASVTHLNKTAIGQVLRHHYGFGRSFADVCRRGAFRPRFLGRRWAAPVSGVLRWSLTMRRLPRQRGFTTAIATRCVVSLCLLAWTAGLIRGGSARGRR